MTWLAVVFTSGTCLLSSTASKIIRCPQFGGGTFSHPSGVKRVSGRGYRLGLPADSFGPSAGRLQSETRVTRAGERSKDVEQTSQTKMGEERARSSGVWDARNGSKRS
jgi:hypothetical protein